MKIIRIALSVTLIAMLAITSCKKEENTETEVIFNFKHFVGNEELQFDEIKYKNAFGNDYSVSTLKYFVSNITLHTDGGIYTINGAHYVDATDNSTLTFAPGIKFPAGTYNKVSFTYGLDSVNNVTGRFPNPPENLMEWPIAMGGGYHYMKLEGKFDSTGVVKNYQAHTGPTMGNDNSFEVTLNEANFSCSCVTKTIIFEMDINNWWTNPNTLDLNNISGIMGNQNMQEKFKANGSDVFSATVN